MIISLLRSILYGTVQGITEWLPISSSGHLILLDSLIGFPTSAPVGGEYRELYMLLLQLSSILAIIVLSFRRLNPFSRQKSRLESHETLKLWLKIIVAELPLVAVALVFEGIISKYLMNTGIVLSALTVYGVAFIILEKRKSKKTADHISYGKALGIGAFQALSVIPGTSRSGSTILGGMLLGVERGKAAEFSFFLAIPTMLGACALKLEDFIFGSAPSLNTEQVAVLAVGMLMSFAVSLVCARFLLEFVKKHSFAPFGVYRILLAAVIFLILKLR